MSVNRNWIEETIKKYDEIQKLRQLALTFLNYTRSKTLEEDVSPDVVNAALKLFMLTECESNEFVPDADDMPYIKRQIRGMKNITYEKRSQKILDDMDEALTLFNAETIEKLRNN